MATWYVDPLSGNNSHDGTVPVFTSGTTGPWATTQKALDECNAGVIAAGDTVLLMATAAETTAVELATKVSKRVNFVGANAAGTVDGTRYRLTTGSAITSLLNFQHGGPHIFALVDFDAAGSATHAVDCDNVAVVTLWCKFRNATSYGWFQGVSGGQASARHFADEFYSNANGAYVRGAVCVECAAHDNSGRGFYYLQTCVMARCRSYKNGASGFDSVQTDSCMWRCTADDNSLHGVTSNFNNAVGIVGGCLFTRNVYGLESVGTSPAGSLLLANLFGSGAMANSSGDNSLSTSSEYLSASGDPDYLDPDGSTVDLDYASGTPAADPFAPFTQFIGAGFEVGSSGGSSGIQRHPGMSGGFAA